MILMFITNNIEVAQIAERAGVDRIFIDLETVGKQERQGGMDTVQSHHTVEDVRAMRAALRASELFVRVNPIYEGSEQEIHAVLAAGAQVIMLPYFKTRSRSLRFFPMWMAAPEPACYLKPRNPLNVWTKFSRWMGLMNAISALMICIWATIANLCSNCWLMEWWIILFRNSNLQKSRMASAESPEWEPVYYRLTKSWASMSVWDHPW